jgi:multidrug resistance efflux pump
LSRSFPKAALVASALVMSADALDAKYQKASKGDATAFIDPDGYKKNVASAEKDFLTELAKQKALQAR